MKNEQTGDCPLDVRHCYANPYNRIICVVVTLISYLLITPPTSDIAIVLGANQYNWYNKYLNNLLKYMYIKELWY